MAIPLYISAAWYLAKSCGRNITFKIVGYYPVFILPVIVLVLPYVLLFQKANQNGSTFLNCL
ncbi:MAG: hypothetical protein U0525_04290 [Patescibacteria group bacterium]